MSASPGSLSAFRLLPLFLVSLVAIGVEIALTRFFALASWAEYGYWVISITMVGLTASGVVASLGEKWLRRHGEWLVSALPLLLIAAAAGGWHATTIVPFNPLELQNRVLWHGQLGNILTYYAVLFPYFFLTGLYISLFFLRHSAEVARVYGFDLAGAGCGAVLVLVLLYFVHPFDLVAALVPLLAVAALCTLSAQRRKAAFAVASLALLAIAEAVILSSPARINEYKEIFGPLNAPGSRIVTEIRSPKGVYHVLDAFTERVDTDLSNNPIAGSTAELPRTFGLYLDGNRIGSLPRTGIEVAYSGASLDALPYLLRPGASVLLIGASGGFRIEEALALGAASITATESDRLLLRLLQQGMPPAVPYRQDKRVVVLGSDPLARGLASSPGFDIVDISRDYLGQSELNRLALSREGIEALLQRLQGSGNAILSIPVSVREFTNYAAKLMATVADVLPARAAQERVLIYRSAWNLRILIAAKAWSAEDIETALRFCRDRSFDIVHHPGVDPRRLEIFNELPVVTFAATPAVIAGDALALEAAALLRGQPSPYHGFFDLRPSTLDRPAFHATLPPAELPTILSQIERVPREELPSLINIAVLAQALVIAAVVLALPLLRRTTSRPPLRSIFSAVVYFSGLGLGFLWLEIYLIEMVAYYTHDRTVAFALVLATMLIGSGGGSLFAARYAGEPRRGLGVAVIGILSWCLLAAVGLQAVFLLTMDQPLTLKVVVAMLVAAPLAFFLGLPMAIGLSQFQPRYVSFLPWAWSVNGAWSIIATPLANLVALTVGLKLLVGGAALSYLLVWHSLPGFEGRQAGRRGE